MNNQLGPYSITLWPPAASSVASEVDLVIVCFTLLTLFLTVPIFVSYTYFALKYRHGRQVDRSHREKRNAALEMSWMLIPYFLTLVFMVWSARIYDYNQNPPAGTMNISAIGRQWMWKFQHPGGQWEINDLHVPVNQAIKINMISQDVIHSLYVPALRIQMEVLPDRYTSMWFKADRPGAYRLYCSEFCGTDHSIMDGVLYVMTPADYQHWLTQSGTARSLAAGGKQLFSAYGCSGCHGAGSTVRAPSLVGVYGRPVPLEAGGTLIADDGYIRDKILMPDDNKIAGYKQIMPSFKGKVSEDDLVRLIAYIKSLGEDSQQAPTGSTVQ